MVRDKLMLEWGTETDPEDVGSRGIDVGDENSL